MRTRIKYNKTKEPGVYKSMKLISDLSQAEYYITLDSNTGVLRIVNTRQQRMVYEDTVKSCNMIVMKRYARNKLKKLGVGLDSEIRDYERKIGANQHKSWVHEERDNSNLSADELEEALKSLED